MGEELDMVLEDLLMEDLSGLRQYEREARIVLHGLLRKAAETITSQKLLIENLQENYAELLGENYRLSFQLVDAIEREKELQVALVEAAVPLEGLLLTKETSKTDLRLSEEAWMEIHNAVQSIRNELAERG